MGVPVLGHGNGVVRALERRIARYVSAALRRGRVWAARVCGWQRESQAMCELSNKTLDKTTQIR